MTASDGPSWIVRFKGGACIYLLCSRLWWMVAMDMLMVMMMVVGSPRICLRACHLHQSVRGFAIAPCNEIQSMLQQTVGGQQHLAALLYGFRTSWKGQDQSAFLACRRGCRSAKSNATRQTRQGCQWSLCKRVLGKSMGQTTRLLVQ